MSRVLVSSSGKPSNRFTRPAIGVSRMALVQSSQVRSTATVQSLAGRNAAPRPKARGNCSVPEAAAFVTSALSLEAARSVPSKSERSGPW